MRLIYFSCREQSSPVVAKLIDLVNSEQAPRFPRLKPRSIS